MKRRTRHGIVGIVGIGVGVLMLGTARPVGAEGARTVCVFDPSGANGDVFQIMKDYQNAALAWGVRLNLKPYTDERTAVEDFKARRCQAALLTGVRVRAFVPFSGTIEALGALPTYDQLEMVLRSLASPEATPLMRKGPYETAAIFPAGAVYLLVRDRALRTVEQLAGRRIATLDFDEAARVMVAQVGASAVLADIGTFGGMFNNGSVELCYAPATAVQPLELSKGLGKAGGILRFPLAQLTFQLLIRPADFQAGFGEESRRHAVGSFRSILKLVEQAEGRIEPRHWVDISPADQERYHALLRRVRIRLRDQEQVYDPRMLTLLRRVRCRVDSQKQECAEPRE